jgi:UDP-2-acetamido-2,6-beta-L-arabino-hexul-4-ose reductase
MFRPCFVSLVTLRHIAHMMSEPGASRARIERLATHADARGFVFEPADAAELGGQRNVHVVVSQPGAVRGNHVHARATEIISVIGPALIRYRENGADHDVAVAEREAVRCIFPPGVPHAIRNTGTAPQVLVAFSTLVHDPDHPDISRVELLA